MNQHLEKVAAHHDYLSADYDSNYFERFALYHKVTLDNIRRFLPEEKGSVILDAGGGTGIWSVELLKMGYRVALTDISAEMLRQAKKKVRELGLESQIEIIVSDICSMHQFPDNHFAIGRSAFILWQSPRGY